MLAKIRAHQRSVPSPVVFGVGRRVDADEAAAPANEALEGRLLVVIEHVARRAQKDDCSIACQTSIAESARIFGRVDLPTALTRQLGQRLDARWNRIVTVLGGLRKDE